MCLYVYFLDFLFSILSAVFLDITAYLLEMGSYYFYTLYLLTRFY